MYDTFVFMPKQVRLAPSNGKAEKINPYCKFKIGVYSAKTKVALYEGENLHWDEKVAIFRKPKEKHCRLKVKDRHRISLRAFVEQATIHLDPIKEKEKIVEWFPLINHDKVVGEIEIECRYISDIQRPIGAARAIVI